MKETKGKSGKVKCDFGKFRSFFFLSLLPLFLLPLLSSGMAVCYFLSDKLKWPSAISHNIATDTLAPVARLRTGREESE
jgi:hypothetical protein